LIGRDVPDLTVKQRPARDEVEWIRTAGRYSANGMIDSVLKVTDGARRVPRRADWCKKEPHPGDRRGGAGTTPGGRNTRLL